MALELALDWRVSSFRMATVGSSTHEGVTPDSALALELSRLVVSSPSTGILVLDLVPDDGGNTDDNCFSVLIVKVKLIKIINTHHKQKCQIGKMYFYNSVSHND